MRKIDASAVTNSIGLPVKSGTVIHVQNAYVEAIGEAIKGLIGATYNPAVLYILQGMVNSGSSPNYIISPGSCFYNGEMYICDGATFTISGPNVAVANITTSFFSAPNADGVQFTDGIVRNIHQINKVSIVQALGGSGISNYVSAQRINTNQPNVSIAPGAGISIGGTFPAFTVTNTSLNAPEIIGKGSIPIGDLNSTTDLDAFTTLISGGSSGLSAYRYTFPAAFPPGTNYMIYLMCKNDGYSTTAGFAFNSIISLQAGAKDNLGFYFALSTTNTSSVQAITVDYILIGL